jgi:hypothetical protein
VGDGLHRRSWVWTVRARLATFRGGAAGGGATQVLRDGASSVRAARED